MSFVVGGFISRTQKDLGVDLLLFRGGFPLVKAQRKSLGAVDWKAPKLRAGDVIAKLVHR